MEKKKQTINFEALTPDSGEARTLEAGYDWIIPSMGRKPLTDEQREELRRRLREAGFQTD